MVALVMSPQYKSRRDGVILFVSQSLNPNCFFCVPMKNRDDEKYIGISALLPIRSGELRPGCVLLLSTEKVPAAQPATPQRGCYVSVGSNAAVKVP